ncbi:Rrf2 family transcriptional regulator [Pseudomonas sp. MGal98]|uniref:RrF2 family transcriptional regulator n=1 Tax=Pseudomonas sp. MGal98 TaxID=3162460 RepID=UPI0032EAB270
MGYAMSDRRLPRMLHVLVHMHLLGGTETSETIAKMLNTNPVVVRRTMAALRQKGIVTSMGGRSGGWRLAKPASALTVEEVYDALQAGSAFSIGLSDNHGACPVACSVNQFLDKAMVNAEEALREAFRGATIADLAAAFR